MKSIEPGDVVRLKGGVVKMTVHEVDGVAIHAQWFEKIDDGEYLCSCWFSAETMENVG